MVSFEEGVRLQICRDSATIRVFPFFQDGAPKYATGHTTGMSLESDRHLLLAMR